MDGTGGSTGEVWNVVEWTVAATDREAAADLVARLTGSGWEVLDEETLDHGAPGRVTFRIFEDAEGAGALAAEISEHAEGLREAGLLSEVGSVAVRAVPKVDWAARVREEFRPFQVGPFWVRPPWAEARAGLRDLVILPGPAFGTGRHPTTRLCLSAMAELAGTRTYRSVLDLGCGSGILSVAAARLWDAEVLGVDVDRDAVGNAEENAESNGLVDRIRFRVARDGPDGTFGLVLANIRLPVLERFAPRFGGWVRPGGTLVLSGLLATEQQAMLEALDRAGGGFRLIRELGEEEWICLVLDRVEEGR